MITVAELIMELGGPSAVARMIRVRQSAASEMKRRGTIPPRYWRDLIQGAQEAGKRVVTSDLLVDLHARPARSADPPGSLDNHGVGPP